MTKKWIQRGQLENSIKTLTNIIKVIKILNENNLILKTFVSGLILFIMGCGRFEARQMAQEISKTPSQLVVRNLESSACPQLTGQYLCDTDSEPLKLSFRSQINNKGQSTFIFFDQPYMTMEAPDFVFDQLALENGELILDGQIHDRSAAVINNLKIIQQEILKSAPHPTVLELGEEILTPIREGVFEKADFKYVGACHEQTVDLIYNYNKTQFQFEFQIESEQKLQMKIWTPQDTGQIGEQVLKCRLQNSSPAERPQFFQKWKSSGSSSVVTPAIGASSGAASSVVEPPRSSSSPASVVKERLTLVEQFEEFEKIYPKEIELQISESQNWTQADPILITLVSTHEILNKGRFEIKSLHLGSRKAFVNGVKLVTDPMTRMIVDLRQKTVLLESERDGSEQVGQVMLDIKNGQISFVTSQVKLDNKKLKVTFQKAFWGSSQLNLERVKN